MLVEIRAVVAGVQPAVEPVRLSPQDVAARLPAAAANVRAFVDFSLGKVAASLWCQMRIWRVERHQHIIFPVLDEMAPCWIGSITGPIAVTLSSDELPGSSSQLGHSSS